MQCLSIWVCLTFFLFKFRLLIFGKNKPETKKWQKCVILGETRTMLTCLILVDAKLGHLIVVKSASFPHYKLTFFPLQIIGTLWGRQFETMQVSSFLIYTCPLILASMSDSCLCNNSYCGVCKMLIFYLHHPFCLY